MLDTAVCNVLLKLHHAITVMLAELVLHGAALVAPQRLVGFW
jgi:hypothetical protein